MFLSFILVSSLSLLVNAQLNPCDGQPNPCYDQVTGCETIFAPVNDAPSPLCFDNAYASFVDLCHKTCQICCVEPCVDVNDRCSVWTDGFCTNPFYTDEERWKECRKKCKLC
ncbi:hypothetical protein PMAYCL1PPCAC_07320 [Pristionchus mayeri]|uniref:ShKT domain-containing protein n=1 Tax=Pristionchus mayeri TaxID=1317129 RepID=A0AAN4ZHM9_9BILA|nr:hypothetical protein PMAYCL1PPCAC_07320 [Pristionchus mayeri]